VVGGGYKYCQLGEGNCFLRIPQDCALRPMITGWFAEFDTLAAGEAAPPVAYGPGAARFAGATYDPTSHYRAARVFDFFEQEDLTPEFLREVSQHQVGFLARSFDALDPDPRVITRDHAVTLPELGGFLALQSARAAELCRQLRDRGVLTDYRADVLRLGPAPYLSDAQLREAMQALGSVIKERGS
jgi:kynureninase